MKIITVLTDADGEFTYERRLAGVVKAIAIDVGTLTTPDIVISDGVWDTEILTVAGLAADAVYHPLAPGHDTDGEVLGDTLVEPAIFGSLKIEVTGGGANFTGTIRVLFG
jgi:hypothetical protein